jgi:hypothetical protein
MDDVASGAVQVLRQVTPLLALIGSFSANADPSFAGQPWIFKDDILVRVEGQSVFYGSNAVALVCSDAGGWNEPQPLITPRFNRLQVDIWADPLRDASHSITETSGGTKQRIKAVFAVMNFALHRTNPDMQLWGDLRTVGCQLLTEPQALLEPDGDGIYKGTAYYGVSVFGVTDVLV